MSYYWFNREEILQKKERYSKEKAAVYYLQNKEVIKEKAKNRYKNLSEEEKNKIKEYQKRRYQELIQYKKETFAFLGVLRYLNKACVFFICAKYFDKKNKTVLITSISILLYSSRKIVFRDDLFKDDL